MLPKSLFFLLIKNNWLDIHASLLLFWSSSIWKHDWKESKLTDVEWSPFFSHMFMCCKKHTFFLLQSLFSALTAVTKVYTVKDLLVFWVLFFSCLFTFYKIKFTIYTKTSTKFFFLLKIIKHVNNRRKLYSFSSKYSYFPNPLFFY
jgi:hypothetical protein